MDIEEIQNVMNARTEILNDNEVYRGRLIIPLITRRVVSSFKIQSKSVIDVIPALELIDNQPRGLKVLTLHVARLINDHRPKLRKIDGHKFIICDVIINNHSVLDYSDISVRDVTEVTFNKESIKSYLYAVNTFPYKSEMAFKLQLFLSDKFK